MAIRDVVETGIKKIRNSYIILAVCSLLILLISAALGVNYVRALYVQEEIENIPVDFQEEYEKIAERESLAYTGLLTIILERRRIRESWTNRNREQLYESCQPIFNDLKAKFNVTHFYFIDTTGVCFLRVHKKNSFGDTINRYTFLEAQKTGTMSEGIELGKYGTLTLRVVYPWYYEGKLLGYVELGEEMEQFMPVISNVINSELFILVKKDLLEKTQWEEGLQFGVQNKHYDWNYNDDFVVTFNSTKNAPVELNSLLENESFKSNKQEHYAYNTTELHDVTSATIGKILFIKNQAELYNSVERIKLIVTLVFFFFGGGLLLVSLVFLGKIHNRIAENLEEIQKEVKEREKVEVELRKYQEELEEKVKSRTKQLEDHKNNLEEIVKERTRELLDKNRELENLYEKDRRGKEELERTYHEFKETQKQLIHSEKLASLGILSAAIGHEINNPLGALKGGLGILSQDFNAILPLLSKLSQVKTLGLKELDNLNQTLNAINLNIVIDDFNTLLKKLIEGTDHTIDVIKSLKEFSRKDSDEFSYNDIREGMDSTLVLLKHRIDKGDIDLFFEFDPGIEKIFCQRGPMSMVYMNILSNAVDTIYEKCSKDPSHRGKIVISARQANSKVYISIEDNGEGMPEEVMDKVFTAFYSTKQSGKGTGLGMSISMDIIKKHEGDIKIESTPGKGSIFTIVLPYRTERDSIQ